MSPELVAILGVVLGGGFAGSIAVFRKAGPESAAIATETLIKVNEELRREIARLSGEVEKLREALKKSP